MFDTALVLGLTAALLNGTAFVLYSIRTKSGDSKPNPVSWFIWAGLSTMNAFTFQEVSGSIAVTLQFFVGSAGCILTFLYVLVIGKVDWPEWNDVWCLVFGLLAAVVWWEFRSAAGGNALVVLAFVISFIPTYGGVLRDPFKEKPLPWVVWTVGFLTATVNVFVQGSGPMVFLSPVVLCVAHGGIAFLSAERRKVRFRRA